MKNNVVFLGLVAVVVSIQSAQGAGDVEAGKAKSVTCVACHALDRKGMAPEFPDLAAQVPGYIAKALADFKAGVRQNPIMAGQVASLSEQDMRDLDAYFSSLPPIYGSVSEEEGRGEGMESAKQLYRGGDVEMGIAACISCHGPGGHGIPTRFPRVAGQSPEYLEAQLLAFKSGQRPDDIMSSIAFRMSEEQIKAVSRYMHALR